MRTIETTFETFGASVLLLGFKGDSNATEILIDCEDALEEYQGTMAALSITGPDLKVYPGDISLDEDGVVHWVVAARDCGIAGHGSVRIDLVDDAETVVASAEASTIIMKTNMKNIAPDQIADWTEAASVALQELKNALLDLYDGEDTTNASEAARRLAETGRVNAELLRVSAESARVTAESARVTAENARATAETARATAETARATAETARGTAETARASAETARVSEFSTIEANAQAALSYIGPSEDSSTASATHAAGSYFIYDGKLYKATADIAIGDTITSGTNCAQVPGGTMGEVSDLKSASEQQMRNIGFLGLNDGAGSDTYRGVTVKRIGNRVHVNGTATGNGQFKLTGAIAHAVGVSGWVDERIPLISGHEYSLILTPVSGSATLTGASSVYVYDSAGEAIVSRSYGNAEDGIIIVPSFSSKFTVGESVIPSCITFYSRDENIYSDYVLQIELVDYTEINAIQARMNDYAEINALRTYASKHAPAHQNAIFGIYQYHPTFSFNGETVTVKTKGPGRAVWNNGYTSDANTGEHTYPVQNGEYLVYNTDTHIVRVETASSNLTEYDIIVLYNTKGAIYGQWASMYALEIAKAAKEMAENVDGYVIPSYYNENNYLQDKVDTINTIALGLGRQSLQTFFITDLHWERNAKNSPVLIKYLIDYTGIKTVVANGDYIEKDTTSKLGGYNLLQQFMRKFAKPVGLVSNLYLNTGNHEQNDPSASATSLRIDQPVIGHLLNTPIAYKIHSIDGENSFFVDDDSVKIRFYCIECDYNSSISLSLRAKLFTSMLNVPEGYAVVLFSHTGINSSDNTQLTGRFGQIMECGAAMNDGVPVTINDVTYNFTGKARTFVGAFVGHLHKNVYVIYDDRFPVIGTAADTIDSIYSDTRVEGTITEQAFDVVQIDVAAKRIYCTRIGAGEDRVFSFGEDAGLITE